MIYRIVLLSVTLVFSFSSFSQDLEYAKQVVNTLASDEYKGRGYVGDGDKIAANYIKEEFEKIGLITFKKNYFQEFKTSVNTFPSEMNLSINGKKQIAGVDFLIDPGSPGIEGEFATTVLNIEEIFNEAKLFAKLKDSKGNFIIIPTYKKDDYTKEQQQQIIDVINYIMYSDENPAAGSIILSNDKLTWSGSTRVFPKPTFTVKNDSTLLEVEKVIVEVENKFIKKYKTQNVLGYLEGENQDSMIVFIGHYDHLGMMGEDAVFNGANDNASGVAMLLNLAKYYKENHPKYNTAFIAFGAEELGLLGSKYFVENPLFELSKIKFLLNFDISGTGDDGIQVVNGAVYKDKFEKMVEINDENNLLEQVKIRGEACISDHCMFHMKDVPCFYMYTLGGTKAYHDIYDRAENLPLTEFEDYFKLITLFVEKL